MARAPSGTIRAAARLGAPEPGADRAGGMEPRRGRTGGRHRERGDADGRDESGAGEPGDRMHGASFVVSVHLSFFRASAAALPKPSETVGWLKTMSLMSSARAPSLTASAAKWMISEASCPATWAPTSRCVARVEDELEEPGDVPVEAGTDEVVVAALADDDLAAAGAGPFLRLPDRADLGVGVDAPGRAGVVHFDVEAQGVLGRDAGFHDGHGREHEPGQDVAGGVDAGDRSPHPVVDLDLAARARRDPGRGQAELLRVGPAADADHDPVGFDRLAVAEDGPQGAARGRGRSRCARGRPRRRGGCRAS